MSDEPTRPTADLVIVDATLRGLSGRASVAVRDGRILAVSATEPAPRAAEVIDAGGGLVLPSFADAHLHVCKAHTFAAAGDGAVDLYTGEAMAGAAAAVDRAAAVKSRYETDWNADNARRALAAGLRHGVTRVLAFADTDTAAGLHGVRGALRARDEFAGLVTAKVVAFPQDGIVRDPGAAGLVEQALGLGADVVGGIPWIEDGEAAQKAHIDRMVALAVDSGRDVAMLTDDAADPRLRTTEWLARALVARGWEGRGVACHARALGAYTPERFAQVLPIVRDAGLRFVTDPHTGAAFLRALELREAGVPVAIGQDDIADAYYPFGQHNLLEVAFLAAHLWRRFDLPTLEALLDLVTTEAHRVLDGSTVGIEPGAAADLVVLGESDAVEVLRRHAPPRVVLRDGRVVVRSTEQVTFAPEVPDVPLERH
ncbi:cytosine deaminase [Egibacter rhizosphaerae]|uniref:Cytosine deaminase n=1 Tax=Egibacter rhizosphaerae TaxID=1670831 RepID=A0A411YEA3_9ACTN|nr:amidohydrolase family protein [Egibacter rhizosphaerae]QBI19526.1 cytosine deaminase [Egibacter rhizosphaerae]